MAPYMRNDGWMNLMAKRASAIKLRNVVYRHWPTMMMADLDTGEEHEVFDRLYLLWNNQYVTMDRMNIIDESWMYIKAAVESQDIQVGDFVTYNEASYILYKDREEEKQVTNHVQYVNNSYEVFEVLNKFDKKAYTIEIPDDYNPYELVYLEHGTEVILKVPVTPFTFVGSGGLTADRAHHLLLDKAGIPERRLIYKYFDLDTTVHDAIDNDSQWNELNHLWIEFSSEQSSDGIATKDEVYKAYKKGVKLGYEIHSTVHYTKTSPVLKHISDSYIDTFKDEVRQEAIDQLYSDVDYGGIETSDDRYSKFAELVLLRSGEIAYESSEYVKNVSTTIGEVKVVKTPRYVKTGYGTDTDILIGYTLDAEIITSITYTPTKYLPDTNGIFTSIYNTVDRLKPHSSHTAHSSSVSLYTQLSSYEKFLRECSLEFYADRVAGDNWVKATEDNYPYGITKTTYFLKREALGKANHKDVNDLMSVMRYNYTEDEHKSSSFISILTGVLYLVGFMLMALFPVTIYFVPLIMQLYSQMLYNAGYRDAAVQASNASQILGYAGMIIGFAHAYDDILTDKALAIAAAKTIAEKEAAEAAAQSAIQSLVIKMATLTLASPLIKESSTYVSDQLGVDFGVAAAMLIKGGIDLMNGGFNSVSSGLASTLNNINTAMATKVSLEARNMTMSELTEEDQAILDEIEQQERDRMLMYGAYSIDEDKNAIIGDMFFDPIDINERDIVLKFEDTIDSKYTKYYK